LEVDLKIDQFRVKYDSRRATPEQMLEMVRKQGFRGEVVRDASANATAREKVRRDLARFPEDVRKGVQKGYARLTAVQTHGYRDVS
jgi:hypothetical protein